MWRGVEGARANWQETFERWEQMRIELSELIDLGETVVVVGTQHARGAHSGVEVSAGYAGLFEFRDGKAVGVRNYRTREDALEAAETRQ